MYGKQSFLCHGAPNAMIYYNVPSGTFRFSIDRLWFARIVRQTLDIMFFNTVINLYALIVIWLKMFVLVGAHSSLTILKLTDLNVLFNLSTF